MSYSPTYNPGLARFWLIDPIVPKEAEGIQSRNLELADFISAFTTYLCYLLPPIFAGPKFNIWSDKSGVWPKKSFSFESMSSSSSDSTITDPVESAKQFTETFRLSGLVCEYRIGLLPSYAEQKALSNSRFVGSHRELYSRRPG